MKDIEKHTPVLAVTMGDPAGIGPEIAAKAFGNKAIRKYCNPFLIGHSLIMENALKITGIDLQINKIRELSQASFEPEIIDIFENLQVDVIHSIIPLNWNSSFIIFISG